MLISRTTACSRATSLEIRGDVLVIGKLMSF